MVLGKRKQRLDSFLPDKMHIFGGKQCTLRFCLCIIDGMLRRKNVLVYEI